jgi:hypothetical protein
LKRIFYNTCLRAIDRSGRHSEIIQIQANRNEDFRRAWENINGDGSFDPEQVVDVFEFECVG